MKPRTYISFFIFIVFGILPAEAQKKVAVYGIVYDNTCGFESTSSFKGFQLVEADQYRSALKAMKASLKERYPNAKNIHVGSSRFEFGANASHMSVIQWQINLAWRKTCRVNVVVVKFGRTQSEAMEACLKAKRGSSGKNEPHTILENRYW